MSTSQRALLVEDEPSIREIMRLHLTVAGLTVTEVDDGTRALQIAGTDAFDVVILDVMLPGIDGITLCRTIRAGGLNALSPILMVTARDSEADKVLGLESGADDYLTKPFGTRELVARVGALLRHQGRLSRQVSSPPVTARVVSIDADRRLVTVRGVEVKVTKQEFELLQLFVEHPGIVFSRDALLAQVWGGDTFVTDRTVDAVVSRLRRKIETDAQDPEILLTAWGVGYKFVDVE
jgi:DNA-binding response OmpR family regulator